MTETYDEVSDTLIIEFNVNAPFQRIHPAHGLVVLLDEVGKPCGIELENASAVLGDMEYLMVQETEAVSTTMTVDDYDSLTVIV